MKAHFSDYKRFQCVLNKRRAFFLVAIDAAGQKVFIKCLATNDGFKRAQSEFDAARFYQQAFAPLPGYGVLKARACTQFSQGRGALAVDHIALPRGDWWIKWLAGIPALRDDPTKRAAQWLRHFHDAGEPVAMPMHEALDIEACQDRLIAFAREHDILDEQMMVGIATLCTLERGRLVVVCNLHRDYTPANTFMGFKRIIGYDFGKDVRGTPQNDIARYLIKVLWLSRSFLFPRSLRSFQRSRTVFAQHYNRLGQSVDDQLLDIALLNEIVATFKRSENKRNNPRKARSVHQRLAVMTRLFASIVHGSVPPNYAPGDGALATAVAAAKPSDEPQGSANKAPGKRRRHRSL